MSWQQVPPTYHGTLAPQLNPTSSGWLLPGWPTFSAQPGRARAQVETGQQVHVQVQQAEVAVQVKERVEELVMQLVQEILQLVRVRVQGSVIFQPKLQLGLRELPAAPVVHGHLCGVPQQGVHGRGEPLPKGQPKV